MRAHAHRNSCKMVLLILQLLPANHINCVAMCSYHDELMQAYFSDADQDHWVLNFPCFQSAELLGERRVPQDVIASLRCASKTEFKSFAYPSVA